jgi:type 1 glutamine amidotransferase
MMIGFAKVHEVRESFSGQNSRTDVSRAPWHASGWMAIVVSLMMILAACSPERTPTAPDGTTPPAARAPIRVLMLTATAAFRHDSIPTAQAVMTALAASAGDFTITMTEDLPAIRATSLANYDVLFFALTSGELALSPEQQGAMIEFVRGGKGFLGVHSASDTLYEWPDYGRLVGAYFKDHPWTQQGTIIVEDQSHPATRGLGERFSLLEEFYTFRENPRSRVQVLLRLDAASVGASGDYPLAWVHPYGSGRAYYNALGHFPSTWSDSSFQRQLVGAIRWAAGR